MPKRGVSQNGSSGPEVPPVSGVDIAERFLAKKLAELEKKSAPKTDPPERVDPGLARAVTDPHAAEPDTTRKPISPFGYDPKAVGSAEREMAANSRAAARAGGEPKNDASKDASPEAAERQRVVFEVLNKQKDAWLARITAVRDKREFDAVTSDAARNGRYTMDSAPCFVVDKPLGRLLKEHSITDDTEIQSVKNRAFELQAELNVVYLAKKAEVYPVKTDDTKNVAPVSAGTAPSKPAAAAVSPVAVKPVAPAAPAPPVPAAVAPSTPATIATGVPPAAESSKEAPERKQGDFYTGDLWVRGANDDPDREVLHITNVDTTSTAPFADFTISTPGKPEKATNGGTLSFAGLQDKLAAGNYQTKDGADLAQFLGGVKQEAGATSPENRAVPALATIAAVAAETGAKAPEGAGEAGVRPEVAPELTGLDAEIAKLSAEVADARAAFIAVEESQRGTWKNLIRLFPNLSHKSSDDGEVAEYQSQYDKAVAALMNAKLEKLKQPGLGVKELRPAMAVLIRECEFDEAERIYDTRQEMRLGKASQPLLEKMKNLWSEAAEGINGPTTQGEIRAWLKLMVGSAAIAGGAAERTVDKMGTAYLKLSKGKAGKYLLGATIAGGGAVALGLATGGVGSAAVGLLALKRLVAGAGVAVTIEGLSDKVARSMREKKRNSVEADHKVLFDAMENDELAEMLGEKENAKFALFETYLKQISVKARQGEGARRKGDAYRKTAAIFAGAVLGSGVMSQYIGTRAHAAFIPNGAETDASGEQVAPALSEKDSPAVTGGPSVEGGGSTAAAESSLKTVSVAAEKASVLTEKATGFLSVHEVNSGENIWKLAEKAVADTPGMDERSSERFAKLVELKLQTKLDASPELARAAGFVADADGKFSPHNIQAGTKLEIGKLLSAEEMTALIEEAKSSAPLEASVPGPASDTPIRPAVIDMTPKVDPVVIPEALDAAVPPIATGEEKEAIKALFEFTPEQELTRPDGNVMKYIESLPRDEQEKLFHNFKKLSVELFQTSELMSGETYDVRYDPVVHPELSRAKLAEVLSDHKVLAKDSLAGYDRGKNPLHWSQMEETVKFAKASAKAFGVASARAKAGESIQEYVLRMAALTGSKGKKIPGFRMLD